ncbi:hypothetical protein MNL02_03405 [Bartonella krasnovii]|uniref:hypothetical protein n=1 Tax=Bartonella krasnovii TaxID=2267275 RepID=UPI001F4C87F6|nr:hypothetical protein [Bartonella krasnovii]UNF52720.1 hypothetical protein MNL02_03405 [Bartonella krasnovii]
MQKIFGNFTVIRPINSVVLYAHPQSILLIDLLKNAIIFSIINIIICFITPPVTSTGTVLGMGNIVGETMKKN